ncbi:hypothetical protein VUR80DRAFT_5515 [Thermomyces stellatus]
MPAVRNLVARSTIAPRNDDEGFDRDTINVLIIVLSLVVLGLSLASVLLYIRRVRQQRRMTPTGAPPAYKDVRPSHLTIETTDKHGRSSMVVIGKDGEPMLSNPRSPPHSPDNVPEIRITFPDEMDDTGKKQDGRVVLVRMGETSIGLEPVDDEPLPAYEKENKSQFYSIDMEKIGGLKEKEDPPSR